MVDLKPSFDKNGGFLLWSNKHKVSQAEKGTSQNTHNRNIGSMPAYNTSIDQRKEG